jgi:hypothetical protein
VQRHVKVTRIIIIIIIIIALMPFPQQRRKLPPHTMHCTPPRTKQTHFYDVKRCTPSLTRF